MRAGPCARLARIRLPMAVQYFFEGFPIPDGYPAPLKPEPSIHLPLVARPFLAYWTSASSIEYERANMKRNKIANKCSWRKNWNRLKLKPAWTFKTRLPNVSALSLRAMSLDRKEWDYFMDPKQKITFFKDYKVCPRPIPKCALIILWIFYCF